MEHLYKVYDVDENGQHHDTGKVISHNKTKDIYYIIDTLLKSFGFEKYLGNYYLDSSKSDKWPHEITIQYNYTVLDANFRQIGKMKPTWYLKRGI